MKGAQRMGIRSDRQKGLSHVELGKEQHMDPRTAKRYAEPPHKPAHVIASTYHAPNSTSVKGSC